ncbi:MAG: hypothetical protein DCC58_04850 [Chloroflexi bacterium]|nr:MAG: hypothetical protein DCC58_04850 [Chloroflexota bacterium]
MAAWKVDAYRRYFWVSALSMGGRAVQSTAIGYVVYDISGSDFLLGLVSFMQSVPQLLLAPLVGVIVDRYDRRHILALQFTVQALGFALLGVLAVLGALTVPAIGAVVVVMGIANAFSYPSTSALVPSIVPLGAVQSANAIGSLVGNVSRISTPMLVGWMIDLAGIGAALLLGAGFYAPAAGLIVTVPLAAGALAHVAVRGTLRPEQPARTFRGDIGEAFRYIRATPVVRAAVLNDVFPYLFGLSYIALLPAIARETLAGGAQTLGVLFSIGGVGALFGTVAAGMLTGRGRRGRTIWVTMLGFGTSLVLVALGDRYLEILPALFLAGFFQMIYTIQSDTLVQTLSEPKFRGRVLAAQSMINGLMPIGFLQLGIVAELTSPAFAIAVNGCILVGAGIFTLLFRPVMRHLD